MDNKTHIYKYTVECVHCRQEQTIEAHSSDVKKWKNGMLIEDAMPYLSASDREMFISGPCDECWTSMFGDE